MNKVLVGLLSGFLLLVSATPNSFAQICSPGVGPEGGFHGGGMPMMSPGGQHGMMKHGHHLWRLLAGLGLDEKQKEAVKAIRSRVAKDTIRKRADLEIARIDLKDALRKEQVDMGSVETILKKMASLQTEIRLSHIKSMEEIKALLTAEQKKKLKEMREMGPMADKKAHADIHEEDMASADE